MQIDESAKSLFLSQLKTICEDTDAGVSSKTDALPIWVCQNILGITDDVKIKEAIAIGGKNDNGVDIFHLENEHEERSEQYLCWAQIKFCEKLDCVIIKENMTHFGSTIGALTDCPEESNKTFKLKSKEFHDVGGVEAPIRKIMLYVVTGELNKQAKEYVESNEWKRGLGTLKEPSIDFKVFDLFGILSHVTKPATPTLQIQFENNILRKDDPTNNKKSITGHVSANEIVKIAKQHPQTIFTNNPRESLGGTKINEKIIATLKNDNERKKFWKMNNGITAVCSNLEEITTNPAKYKIDDFKVVNGRQTTYALENFSGQHELDDVFLKLTIHEVSDQSESDLISEATNRQNAIKPVDLITNSPELSNLVNECKEKFKKFYFERQTASYKSESNSIKKDVTRKRVLEKNNTSRAYYAYDNKDDKDPHNAMYIQDPILFDIKGQEYAKVFHGRMIKDFIIPHIFMAILTSLHKKWKNSKNGNIESRDTDILSKKIVRYFILHLIGVSMDNMKKDDRENVEKKMIEIFENIGPKETLPDSFLGIGKKAFHKFMMCFNQVEDLLTDKIKEKRKSQPNYIIDGNDIMNSLKNNGKGASLHKFLETNIRNNNLYSDPIKSKLLELISPDNMD